MGTCFGEVLTQEVEVLATLRVGGSGVQKGGGGRGGG